MRYLALTLAVVASLAVAACALNPTGRPGGGDGRGCEPPRDKAPECRQ